MTCSLITKSPSIQMSKQVSDFYLPSIQQFISTSKKDPSTSDLVAMVPSRLTHKINKASFFSLFNMSSLLHYRHPRKQPEQLMWPVAKTFEGLLVSVHSQGAVDFCPWPPTPLKCVWQFTSVSLIKAQGQAGKYFSSSCLRYRTFRASHATKELDFVCFISF